jgi:glucokinase
MNTLAIDVGGTKVTMAVFEGDRMVRRQSHATDREGGRDWMLARISATGSAWRNELPIERCGIGFGGPVVFREQKIALSTHVAGWSDFALTAYVSGLFAVPAVMDNDANAGALGEHVYGAGKGCDPLFYMTLSTGIGGGIVFGGCIVRGADSYAGEIGHTIIDPEGPQCLCGARGCYERLCSGLWLQRDHGRDARELMDDPAFVGRYVVRLAAGLKTCLMLLNPARIVIGGGMSKAGEKLFGPLRDELRRQMTAWSHARVDVQPAALADDSVLYGALELAKRL